MERFGEVVFYLALVVGVGGAAIAFSTLVSLLVASIRGRGYQRPMYLNYAQLAFGLAIPAMIVGLVLWGRLPWWFILLFAPFVALRFFLFGAGRSLSRRRPR